MGEVGVGVIGLGFMGRTHVACYRDAAASGLPCRLVAVADQDASRRSGRGEGVGNISTGAQAAQIFDPARVRGYADWRELLEDPGVSLVSICTPTPTHVELALAAIAAGKHVLIEKPLALTSAEGRLVAESAAKTKNIVMPGMCIRFWPAYAWLKRAIDSGEYGPVRSATFQRLGSTPAWADFYADASRSGGALVDLHIHDADFVRFCFGDPESVVSAGSVNHVTTLYRFAEGPRMVMAEGGWGHEPGFGFRMRFVVCFEGATAEFDLGRESPLRLSRGSGSTPVEVGPLTGYDAEIRHLVSCIASGRGRADVTVADAVASLELLEAERSSLERGSAAAPVGSAGVRGGRA
ncbi:MAG: Gfo/Idh/MocA family oxidoreductase [Phycisphaerales bacterium]|nr:Gfo/Idh/MocA family oxidoreductase [Phycisphaerales bacterium]